MQLPCKNRPKRRAFKTRQRKISLKQHPQSQLRASRANASLSIQRSKPPPRSRRKALQVRLPKLSKMSSQLSELNLSVKRLRKLGWLRRWQRRKLPRKQRKSASEMKLNSK